MSIDSILNSGDRTPPANAPRKESYRDRALRNPENNVFEKAYLRTSEFTYRAIERLIIEIQRLIEHILIESRPVFIFRTNVVGQFRDVTFIFVSNAVNVENSRKQYYVRNNVFERNKRTVRSFYY